MPKIPSSVRSLDTAATSLLASANLLSSGRGESSYLLRFYSVECAMKARYIRFELANPNADTSKIPQEAFGKSGHDLNAGLKALRAPASLRAAPCLKLKKSNVSVQVHDAHTVWRYHIPHEGAVGLEAWLNDMTTWLKESK
jgi:hypothetical protein